MTLTAKGRNILFAVVLLEGYVVLAAELLAIRLLIPFVGSGTEIVAIIISAVLLPLAAGYHFGAARYTHAVQQHVAQRRKEYPTVRRLLLRNVLSAMGILTVGLSYMVLEVLFGILENLYVARVLQTTLYVLVFLVYPVFLLAQTVPLISHYFSSKHLGEHTGRMLFFSTAGSFLGSICSTLILMNTIGVHYTAVFTLGLLAFIGFLLVRRLRDYNLILISLFMAGAVILNHSNVMRMMHIVSNNSYNMISVHDIGVTNDRLMKVNRSYSSFYTENPQHRFPYIAFIQDNFIKTIPPETTKDILVIGAGGFTMGLGDTRNRYTYVDIDPSIKDVAETHFLKQELTPNNHFVPLSARAFLREDKKRYDLIILEAYTNRYSIPMECTSVEFLQAVKARLKKGGIVISNFIGKANFDERFTARYRNSFASVFPMHGVQVVPPFSPWVKNPNAVTNMLFIYYDHAYAKERGVYTDNLNTYSLDH